MGKISFRLNKGLTITEPKEPKSIYLRFIINGQQDFNASTGLKVALDDWNAEKMEVKNRAALKNRFEINKQLSEIREFFELMNIQSVGQGKPLTYAYVSKKYKAFKNRNVEEKKTGLFEFLELFVEEAKVKPNPNTKRLAAQSTINVYNRTKEVLKEFRDDNGKIDFEDIDYDFYCDFIEYCNDKDYSTNTIGKFIKTLKTILNEATERGVNTKLDFRSKRFSVMTEEVSKIYLNLDELKSIEKLDLSDNPKLDLARNWFLIGAFTGLRVSDFNSLTKSHFEVNNGKEMIRIKTQKTGASVAIPLHPVIKEIVERKPEILDEKLTEQELNSLIKQVGRKAKITDLTEASITKGGKKIVTRLSKCELITTHTARRSFCTNAYLADISPMDIRSISGHKTEKAFLTYIRATEIQKAIKISSHEFFQPQIKLRKI